MGNIWKNKQIKKIEMPQNRFSLAKARVVEQTESDGRKIPESGLKVWRVY